VRHVVDMNQFLRDLSLGGEDSSRVSIQRINFSRVSSTREPAVRFAAKEATVKALGRDRGVGCWNRGRPRLLMATPLILRGRAAGASKSLDSSVGR